MLRTSIQGGAATVFLQQLHKGGHANQVAHVLQVVALAVQPQKLCGHLVHPLDVVFGIQQQRTVRVGLKGGQKLLEPLLLAARTRLVVPEHFLYTVGQLRHGANHLRRRCAGVARQPAQQALHAEVVQQPQHNCHEGNEAEAGARPGN